MYQTIRIKRASKLQYLQGYLVIFDGNSEKRVFLKDVSLLLIESTSSLVTMPLLIQLVKHNVSVIFCDEKHNPIGTINGLNVHYNTSGHFYKQLEWKEKTKEILWMEIVKQKIAMQKHVLETFEKENTSLLETYINEVELNDLTNREGLAAKVHFNALFGKGFNRQEQSVINGLLDYGYAIILSCFNREITGAGYLTNLGIFHRGKTNPFNLSCDFMEAFRPLVDMFAYINLDKKDPIKVMRKIITKKVIINNEERYIDDAIRIYVERMINYLNEERDSIPSLMFKDVNHYKENESNETNNHV